MISGTLKGYVNISIEPSETYNPLTVQNVLRDLFSYHLKGVHSMSEKRDARKRMDQLVGKYTAQLCKSKTDTPIVLPQVTVKRAFQLQDIFLSKAAIFVQLGWVDPAGRFISLTQIELDSLRERLQKEEKEAS